MSSTNKTTNLNLNSWVGIDKPQRTDFVNDNAILDKVIGEHLANTDLHVTEELLTRINGDFTIGYLTGNGEETEVTVFPFTPKFVLIFMKNAPLVSYDSTNNYMICNSGIAVNSPILESTPGLLLFADEFQRKQTISTPEDGIFYNLNENEKKYIYIAFR